MRVRFILFLVLLLPLVEIALFVLIGSAIGLWATLAWVLLAAFLGVLLVRYEGLGALHRAGQALFRGEHPAGVLWQSGLRVAAGVLLAIPGFFTDALAMGLWLYSLRRQPHTAAVTANHVPPQRGSGNPDPRIIEGEVRRED